MRSGSPDIVIIGSGMGGATLAYGLAGSGAQILVLERGRKLEDGPDARDARAIFQRNVFRPIENWYDRDGNAFNPGNYYYVGGNSKLYGAVLIRFRREDFETLEHEGGISPAWPIRYAELEPYYARAEALYEVRGRAGEDPTEPPRSTPYPYPPVPDERPIALTRERLKRVGLRPFSLPLAVDLDVWIARAQTGWDAFPNTGLGKKDAETCAMRRALKHDTVRLETGAEVTRLLLAPDGRRIAAVEYRRNGEISRVLPKLVVLSAGAVNSAALLLRSADDAMPQGLANGSGQIGRHFMNHNCSALLAVDPRLRNDSVYQKTFGLNDFYLEDGDGGPPLGNVQLLGRVTGAILKSALRWCPQAPLELISRHAVDWYLMSEDLPDAESRVRVDGERIILDWRRTNIGTHRRLIAKMREVLRAAGFPITIAKAFDRKTPSHQCGTVRFGTDPARAALDPFCRAFDHRNLFVVDASFMPSSAAVNPALTIAAQALRVADYIRSVDLAA